MAILFYTQPSVHTGGILVAPQWGYTKENFNTRVLAPTLEYFHTHSAQLVNLPHILNRLLRSLQTPLDLPLERYATLVVDDAIHVAGALRMTTPLQKGMVFKGGFYSVNDPEIYLATDTYFNFEEVDKSWKRIAAVRPLLHPKTDLTLTLPNGKEYGDEHGLSVILINPAMLAVQYRAYLIDAGRTNTDGSMKRFLSRFVIPNMLQSTADLAFLNRMIASHRNQPASNVERTQYNFNTPDLTYYIDNVIDHVLVSLTRVHNDFDTLMTTIPSFMSASQRTALKMPPLMSTRQVDWALMAARLKYFTFAMELANKSNGNPNQAIINQAYRSMKTWGALEMMEEQLPPETFQEIKGYCQQIFEAVGQKLN